MARRDTIPLSTGSNVSKDDVKNKDYLAVVKASKWMKEEPPQPFLFLLTVALTRRTGVGRIQREVERRGGARKDPAAPTLR